MESVAADIIETIERIVGFMILIMGGAGTLYIALTTGKKALIDAQAKKLEAKTKASVDISTVEIAKAKADHEIEVAKEKSDVEISAAKIDMAKKLEELYTKLAEDMEKKFQDMQEEMDKIKDQIDCATREKNMYREAGIKLIHAIENGVKLRAKISADLVNCQDCLVADKELLITLKEVKILFENGDK